LDLLCLVNLILYDHSKKGRKMRKMFIALMMVISMIVTVGEASPYVKSAARELGMHAVDGQITVNDIARAGVTVAVEASSVSATVYGASILGVNATTGTAIASLNGAAAVSATSCVIGAPAAGALTAVTGIVVAPAVVGGVIILGAGALVAFGINELFFSED
jgi:hypothetical protein